MGRHKNISPALTVPSPALIMPSPALITPQPANVFPNILAANVPNNVERNRPFCFFILFLIVLLISCISYSDFLSSITIFVMSSIPSCKIINGVVPDP